MTDEFTLGEEERHRQLGENILEYINAANEREKQVSRSFIDMLVEGYRAKQGQDE